MVPGPLWAAVWKWLPLHPMGAMAAVGSILGEGPTNGPPQVRAGYFTNADLRASVSGCAVWHGGQDSVVEATASSILALPPCPVPPHPCFSLPLLLVGTAGVQAGYIGCTVAQCDWYRLTPVLPPHQMLYGMFTTLGTSAEKQYWQKQPIDLGSV